MRGAVVRDVARCAGRRLSRHAANLAQRSQGPVVFLAMLQTQDGHGRLELTKFHTPSSQAADQYVPANTPGIRHVAFAAEEIDAVVARLQAQGAKLVGELERYEELPVLLRARPRGDHRRAGRAHRLTGPIHRRPLNARLALSLSRPGNEKRPCRPRGSAFTHHPPSGEGFLRFPLECCFEFRRRLSHFLSHRDQVQPSPGLSRCQGARITDQSVIEEES